MNCLINLVKGGMGAVYRANDRLTGNTVALKRVLVQTENLMFSNRQPFGGVGNHDKAESVRTALINEFMMLATLRHPNIISVLDYGFDDQKQPYFTMELLKNAKPLDEKLNVSLDTKIRFIIEMLQALAYLHRRGVLHQDLKPDNVMVVDNRVKVVDFGLASKVDTNNHDGSLGGTFAYMAPELFEDKPPSIASDLYTIGVIAYQILAGQHPFDLNSSLNMLLLSIMTREPDFDQLPVDDALQAVIKRLMQKLPHERYESANETIRAILEAVNRPLPEESVAIRESFVKAATFVGRKP